MGEYLCCLITLRINKCLSSNAIVYTISLCRYEGVIRLWQMLNSVCSSTYEGMCYTSSSSCITNVNGDCGCSGSSDRNRSTSKRITTRTWIGVLSLVAILSTSECEGVIRKNNTFRNTQGVRTNGDLHITSRRVVSRVGWRPELVCL